MKFEISAILAIILLSSVVSGWKFSDWFKKSKPIIYDQKVHCYNATIHQTVTEIIDDVTIQMLDADLTLGMEIFTEGGNKLVFLQDEWGTAQVRLRKMHENLKICLKEHDMEQWACIHAFKQLAHRVFKNYGKSLKNKYPDDFDNMMTALDENCKDLTTK